MKYFRMTILVISALVAAAVLYAQSDNEFTNNESSAPEVWVYLVEGCERAYTGKEPVTDICYFRAVVNYRGELAGANPIPSSVTIPKEVRKHLVVAELSNTALTHFILLEGSPVRQKLINDIARNLEGYDGVQIDFESVHPNDKEAFFGFLKELKGIIGTKTLSVAVPARTRAVNDAFDYEVLRGIADRLIIMAYDEHWKGSNPGPVASIEWCEKVAQYTRTVIPKEKLIMGVPLYGRAWQNNNYSKEMNYSDVQKIRPSRKAQYAKHPKVEYERRVKVTVFFESVSSIMNKVRMYSRNEIDSIAFWRMGQGPDRVWPVLKKHYENLEKKIQ